MEPAAGGPGPLIMNNKQPQPPPPPPPAAAQPPPGAPRAGGALLPGGKAREFNRNQRKDSEVRSAGGRRLWLWGPSWVPGGLGRAWLGGCHCTGKGAGREAGTPGPGA